MVYLQDGVEFFSVMRFHLASIIMEEKLKETVEPCLYWATCELMETVYNLAVERHGKAYEFEKLFYKVRSRWPDIERIFHAVFRVPVATWLDTHIELRIVGRDLYLSPYKEP